MKVETTFYNTIFGEEIVPTKYCKGCDQDLPITEFRKRGEGEAKKRLYTVCKKCEKEGNKKLRTLKKNYERLNTKIGTCECCGKENVQLHFDHCHTTNEFRGDICEPCNTAIGRLGDDLNGALNILKYMVERDLSCKMKETSENAELHEMMKMTTDAYIIVARGLIEKSKND